MRKSKIEYAHYEWTPIRPFGMHDNLQLNERELNEPLKRKKPQRILVSPGLDIYEVGIPSNWRARIMDVIARADWHTFILVTKNPWHVHDAYLVNLWLGVTITGKFNSDDNERKFRLFQDKVGAFMKFLNLDPLKHDCIWSLSGFDWVVIGSPKKGLKRSAIHQWFDRCAVVGVPLFMRNNVKPIWGQDLIQQYPFTMDEAMDCIDMLLTPVKKEEGIEDDGERIEDIDEKEGD